MFAVATCGSSTLRLMRLKVRSWRSCSLVRPTRRGHSPPTSRTIGPIQEAGLRIAAHAAAYDLPVIPHGNGPYSYHFIASQPNAPFCEYVAASADGRAIRPVLGSLFKGEDLPQNGKLKLSSAPGFGMDIADRSSLKRFEQGH